ncbi:MAG: SPOR domain-containing protein [Prevotellaceae bacterium]|nr:SPOR domain-containing protein [Prevotellaceae bacterium]
MDSFDNILYKIIRRNRRVIIPDIGAFITNSDGDAVFSPLLKQNDGFLEEEMKREGIAEPAVFLKDFVDNLVSVIDKGQHYSIAGLGYFFREGSIHFAFEKNEDEAGKKRSGNTEFVYLPKKRKKCRSGIVSGAICLCLIAFGCLFFLIFDICSSEAPLVSRTKKPANQFAIVDESGDSAAINRETAGLLSRIKNYYVVVACFEEKINAENFVQQCRKTGYGRAEILSMTGILYPVSIGGFSTQNEAMETKLKYDSIYNENSLIYKTK